MPKLKSPFRYPGGKSRLADPILRALADLGSVGESFTDAFVGGGSIALTVAARYPKSRLTLNDLDPCIAAFWRVVVADPEPLKEEILRCSPTIALFNALRAEGPGETDVSRAFFALFFNRTTFSGVLRSGPIGGYEQRSKWTVDCRWNRIALSLAVTAAHQALSGRTEVREDAAWALPDDGLGYFDPPYYKEGPGLYGVSMTNDDHDRLATHLRERDNPWLLSYDDHPEVRSRYGWATVVDLAARYSVSGSDRASWNAKNELLISNVREERWAPPTQMSLSGI